MVVNKPDHLKRLSALPGGCPSWVSPTDAGDARDARDAEARELWDWVLSDVRGAVVESEYQPISTSENFVG